MKLSKLLKPRVATLALTLAAALVPFGAALAGPTVYPTGVTRYDPSRAYNSYVIFTTGGKTRLIDLNGNTVREWNFTGMPVRAVDPKLIDGKLGRVIVQTAYAAPDTGPKWPGQGNLRKSTKLGIVDWDGKIEKEWGDTAPGGAVWQHHDWQLLPGGKFFSLSNTFRKVEGFAHPVVMDDVFYIFGADGKLEWQWNAFDHFDELGFTPDQEKLVRTVNNVDYLHFNAAQTLGPNKWFDAGDERFHPDNIIFDSHRGNIVGIVDRKTGKLVWRVGPNFPKDDSLNASSAAAAPTTQPGQAGEPRGQGRQGKRVPRPVDQLIGQHNAHFIPKGFPGEGNILLFDNQGSTGYPRAQRILDGSRVIEIDPTTQQIVWEYTGSKSGTSDSVFFSSLISGAERLPNGNTLITEGDFGRVFQVTPEGEIVWEYLLPPQPKQVPTEQKRDVLEGYGAAPEIQPANVEPPRPTRGRERRPSLYRANAVPYEWVPDGTPRSEIPVATPDPATFRVPTSDQRVDASDK